MGVRSWRCGSRYEALYRAYAHIVTKKYVQSIRPVALRGITACGVCKFGEGMGLNAPRPQLSCSGDKRGLRGAAAPRTLITGYTVPPLTKLGLFARGTSLYSPSLSLSKCTSSFGGGFAEDQPESWGKLHQRVYGEGCGCRCGFFPILQVKLRRGPKKSNSAEFLVSALACLPLPPPAGLVWREQQQGSHVWPKHQHQKHTKHHPSHHCSFTLI